MSQPQSNRPIGPECLTPVMRNDPSRRRRNSRIDVCIAKRAIKSSSQALDELRAYPDQSRIDSPCPARCCGQLFPHPEGCEMECDVDHRATGPNTGSGVRASDAALAGGSTEGWRLLARRPA